MINLRCSFCQNLYTVSRNEIIAALQMVEAENLHHYDSHCPRCRHANPIPRERLEWAVPNWREVLKETASASGSATASTPAPAAPRPAPQPAPTTQLSASAPKPAAKKAAVKKAPAKKVAKKTAPKKSTTKKAAAKKTKRK